MLKKEGETPPQPAQTPPEGFMGMIISAKPFMSNNADRGWITVFDVNIEKEDELLERRVELRGRKINEIDTRLRKGQEVYILGYENKENRILDRFDRKHEYIDAVKIELPPVEYPDSSSDKENSQGQVFTGTILSKHIFTGTAPGDKDFAAFDVKIKQGDELIKRRVTYFGDLEEIMPNLQLGRQVHIFGVEFTQKTSRGSGHGKKNQKRINAVKLEFPSS